MDTWRSHLSTGRTSRSQAESQSEELVADSFESMLLREELLQGIYAKGYDCKEPFIIQKKTILPLVLGKDVVVQSPPGTGKGSSLAIGVLERIDEDLQELQALVVCKNRDSAAFLHQYLLEFSKFMNVHIYTVSGSKEAKCGNPLLCESQVLIGTLDLIHYMVQSNAINTEELRILAFQDIDEMYRLDLHDQADAVLESVLAHTQIAFFGATTTQEVRDAANEYMRSPTFISFDPQRDLDSYVDREPPLLPPQLMERFLGPDWDKDEPQVKEYFVCVDGQEWKFDLLMDLFDDFQGQQAIVVCNTNGQTEEVAERLNENGFPAMYLNNESSSQDRMRVSRLFLSGTCRYLITTIVQTLSHELDFLNQCPLTIFFDFPTTKEDHRFLVDKIGTEIWPKRKRNVLLVLTSEDFEGFDEYQEFYETNIEELPADISTVMQ